MYDLKQSTALTIQFFAHDANGDGVTAIADGSWTKRISKNGGAFAAMTVTISELENGWYSLPLSTAHTDTLGVLAVSLSATGIKRVNLVWRVVARVSDDLAFPNTSGRGVDVDATGGVEISANQEVKAPSTVIHGPFLRPHGQEATIDFVLYDSSGSFVTTAVGAIGDTKIAQSEAPLVNTTNFFVENGTGYALVLTPTEMTTARGAIYVVDQTNPKVWQDTVLFVETYGATGAQHPGIGVFDPSSIGGLLLWTASDEITGLSDGNKVSTWLDVSGNNNDFSNVTSAEQPLYKVNIVNGKPAVYWDGGGDRHLDAGMSITAKHIFVVAKFEGATFSTFNGLFSGIVNDDANIVFTGGSGTTRWFDSGAVTTLYRMNGTAYAEAAMEAPMNQAGVLSISNSAGWAIAPRIGIDRGTGTRAWNGWVFEVLAYDSVLSASDAGSVEEYLANRYGITLA